MSTSQIQLYDGLHTSPVLCLDECGECALQVIDDTIKETEDAHHGLLLDQIFGLLVRKAIWHLDNRGALTSALSIHQRGDFLRDRGLDAPSHFGSFVVKAHTRHATQTGWQVYGGDMQMTKVSRAQEKTGLPEILPLDKFNKKMDEEHRQTKEKMDIWRQKREAAKAESAIPVCS